jgi:hypothetical protein
MWWKRAARMGVEVTGTLWLAECIVDMSYEKEPTVSLENRMQFISNVTEYRILQKGIHNSMINHLRQNVLSQKYGKSCRASALNIEELLQDLIPDLEDPLEDYQDTSVWFDTMRMLHDEENFRNLNQHQQCFTFEDKKQLTSYPSPSSEEDLIQRILSVYAMERKKQLNLHKQVDRNFMLQETEMQRQQDVQELQEFPMSIRNLILVGTTLVSSLLFAGTRRFFSTGMGIDTVPKVFSRPSKVAAFACLILAGQLLYRATKEQTSPLIAPDKADPDQATAGESFNELIHEWKEYLEELFAEWERIDVGELEHPSSGNVDYDIVRAIPGCTDIKRRNNRKVWPGEEPTDPYPLGKRFYYEFALPTAQIFLFHRMLLPSLATYLPISIAHLTTGLAYISHAAFTETPLHYQQSLFEQGYWAGCKTLLLQSWSQLLGVTKSLPALMLAAFTWARPAAPLASLPEPTSYLIEDTLRYNRMVASLGVALQFIFLGLNFVQDNAVTTFRQLDPSAKLPFRVDSSFAPIPKWNTLDYSSQQQMEQLIQWFSSDYFTVDIRAKRIFQRDVVHLWLMWEKYLRSKKASTGNKSGKSKTNWRHGVDSGSLLWELIYRFSHFIFPELMRCDTTYQGAPAEAVVSSNVLKNMEPNAFDDVLHTIFANTLLVVMEHVFPNPEGTISLNDFVNFMQGITAKTYVLDTPASMGEFVEFVRKDRHIDDAYSEEELLDIVKLTQEKAWKADQMWLKYYEPYCFRAFEQQVGGRIFVHPLARQQLEQQTRHYFRAMDMRMTRQVMVDVGITKDQFKVLIKRYDKQYPSMFILQQEWQKFFANSMLEERIKYVQDLDSNPLKRRVYFRMFGGEMPGGPRKQQDIKAEEEEGKKKN